MTSLVDVEASCRCSYGPSIGCRAVDRSMVNASAAIAALTIVVLIAMFPRESFVVYAATVGTVLCGVVLAHQTAAALSWPRAIGLAPLFCGGLVLSATLLKWTWLPSLDLRSEIVGFDPLRAYFDAADLAASGFDRSVLPSINYPAVLYAYGAAFWLLGTSPVVPLLLNQLLGMCALAMLVRVLAGVVGHDRRKDLGKLGVILAVPEIASFNGLCSRDALVTWLGLLALLPPLSFVAARRVQWKGLLVSAACASAVSLLRPPVLLGIVAAIAACALLCRRRSFATLALAAGLAVLVAVAPDAVKRMGGYEFTYAGSFAADHGEFERSFEGWSENSVGAALLPNNALQAVLFSPVRAGAYLVAPWPGYSFRASELARVESGAWHGLASALSVLVYLALSPLVVAATLWAWRERAAPTRSFVVVMMILLCAVAGGNVIVHERYRIMVMPWYLATAWLGVEAPSVDKLRGKIIPLVLGCAGLALYCVLKYRGHL